MASRKKKRFRKTKVATGGKSPRGIPSKKLQNVEKSVFKAGKGACQITARRYPEEARKEKRGP